MKRKEKGKGTAKKKGEGKRRQIEETKEKEEETRWEEIKQSPWNPPVVHPIHCCEALKESTSNIHNVQ